MIQVLTDSSIIGLLVFVAIFINVLLRIPIFQYTYEYILTHTKKSVRITFYVSVLAFFIILKLLLIQYNKPVFKPTLDWLKHGTQMAENVNIW